ncbi:protein Lines homolog 1 [Ambystoma mexicanum]|uniref:protein Lines homolog 1 n=1 Tax=Ambystoma mexicanum TaxID=8296 RepID=UPI0037E91899
MVDLIQDLQQMHDLLLLGAPLNKDISLCVCLLNLHSCALNIQPSNKHSEHEVEANNCGPSNAAGLCESVSFVNPSPQTCSQRDITLLQLTLIRKLSTKAQCQDTGASSRHQYTEIIQTLLRQEKVDCQLIFLLESSDQLLSHLASKCLSCLVLFLLKEENEVNGSWLAFCLKTFSGYPKSSAVSQCMWSYTAVIKDLLDDQCLPSSESLKKLLPPLDSVFERFYSSMLSPYSDGADQTIPLNHKTANNLSTFLDLLEILVASRLALKSHFACQRVLFLCTSKALAILSSPIQYYISKKLVLLLKKVLLWKAGQDFLCGPLAASPLLRDPFLETDLLLLSNEVLRVVNFGLLQQIPVSAGASFFGGSHVHSEDDIQTGPDLVQLGALSLTLLKALETKVQMESSNNGLMQGVFQSFMFQLLEFLKSHLPSLNNAHSCEWVSMVFIEQDDDMLETAKALLNVYVKSDRLWNRSMDTFAAADDLSCWTHNSGCNPHCVFLFLLKNVAFDATVLLDFLISSETCFLEYFVRYLKFLREEWTQFCYVCMFFDAFKPKEGVPVCKVVTSVQLDNTNSQADMKVSDALSNTSQAMLPTSSPVIVSETDDDQQSILCKSGSLTSGLGTLRSLVDYDSSDESEEDTAEEIHQSCTEDQVTEAIASVCSDLDAELDRLDLRSASANPKDTGNRLVPQDPVHSTSEGMLLKTMLCLEQLQVAVTRLQRRNLFPYNPSALLKLLMHIESLHGSMKPLQSTLSASLTT